MKIELLGHASIKLTGNKVIYIDPYNIKDEVSDADYIFITHDHYDHYDEESINKIRKEDTKIILPKCLEDKRPYLVVEENNHYELDDIQFDTIASYNINKPFHPRDKGYVGYNIIIDGISYYIMGDTDITEEALNVKCDVCFVPIGGTYTMDVKEAISYINQIKLKKAIPIHYGVIVGDKSLGITFKENIDKEIEVEL